MAKPDSALVHRGDGAKVTPLELFFDLIFVLALTQCTALIAADPSWVGITKGLLVLAMLWWSWVGYSWLTSVIDPEEGPVRIAVFAAMIAFLVCALAVPGVFGDLALVFAVAYAGVRAGQIALFVIASGGDPDLRRNVLGLAMSTTLGVGLLTAAAFVDGRLQLGLWIVAVLLDFGGPLVIDSSGWRLSAEHFAERHGLIVLIALGESIVAIGVGSAGELTLATMATAVLGMVVICALWWAYFDVVALAGGHRLASTEPGAAQNSMARDSFSYLHFPMIAGIDLIAVGLKKALADPSKPLYLEVSVALFGGAALYLLALSVFRKRNMGRLNWPRTVFAAGLVLLIVPMTWPASLVAVIVLAVALVALITFEVIKYADGRRYIRSELRH